MTVGEFNRGGSPNLCSILSKCEELDCLSFVKLPPYALAVVFALVMEARMCARAGVWRHHFKAEIKGDVCRRRGEPRWAVVP
jgi:hypothetical protein